MNKVYLIWKIWNDEFEVGGREDDNMMLEEVWKDEEECKKRVNGLNMESNKNVYWDYNSKIVN